MSKTENIYIDFEGNIFIYSKFYELINAKEFLADFWREQIESNFSLNEDFILLNKKLLELFDGIDQTKKDSIHSFLAINEEDIKEQLELLKTVRQTKTLVKTLSSLKFSDLEKRKICMAFLNDPKIVEKSDDEINITATILRNKAVIKQYKKVLKNINEEKRNIAKKLNLSEIIKDTKTCDAFTNNLLSLSELSLFITKTFNHNKFRFYKNPKKISKEIYKKQKSTNKCEQKSL